MTVRVGHKGADAIAPGNTLASFDAALDGFQNRAQQVYNRAGKSCNRCGTKIRRATQGDDNRPLFWCPGCQE